MPHLAPPPIKTWLRPWMRYFTKRLWLRVFKSKMYPKYRLSQFQLDSIEVYRIRLDLLLIFKIARGLVHLPSIVLKFSKRVPYRFLLSPVRTNFLKTHFIHRSSKIWNSIIHDESFRSMSLREFKLHVFLSTIDLSSFCIGRAFKA